jgi:hypothetical protein
MATHKIFLFAQSQAPFPLHISDDEGHVSPKQKPDKDFTTDLRGGDEVIWQILPGIASALTGNILVNIANIVLNSGQEYFSKQPYKNEEDGKWYAIVGDEIPTNGIELEYTITYDVRLSQDPKLRFRPTIGS